MSKIAIGRIRGLEHAAIASPQLTGAGSVRPVADRDDGIPHWRGSCVELRPAPIRALTVGPCDTPGSTLRQPLLVSLVHSAHVSPGSAMPHGRSLQFLMFHRGNRSTPMLAGKVNFVRPARRELPDLAVLQNQLAAVVGRHCPAGVSGCPRYHGVT